MLRITQSSTGADVLTLEGRLVGPWVHELRKTLSSARGQNGPLKIDVSDLTYADEEGEKELWSLHTVGVHFQGKGLFSEFLFKRLSIPLSSPEEGFDNTS